MSVKIENIELTKDHVGRRVIYAPPHSNISPENYPPSNVGTITSYNSTSIWVKFLSPNGEKCNPEHLLWY